MTRYIDIADMQHLVMQHCAARMMAKVAGCIREEFLRWDALKYVNGHPRSPLQAPTAPAWR